jgi:hypothetical protein
MAEDLESAVAVRTSIEMMVTAVAVPLTVAGRAVVDLAVAAFGVTAAAFAVVLRATFRGRPCVPPHVVAFPDPPAPVRAPGSTSLTERSVAPLAASRFPAPGRERTVDP